MRRTRLAAAAGLGGLVFGLWIGGAAIGAQAPATAGTAPRTPWGEPDLQGTWTSEAELSVPFERPREYGTRQMLTDAELAARQATLQKQTASDNADFDLETADTSNAGQVGSATSPPPHWLERGKASRRTSMVIDPADGRIPPMTDEGRERLRRLRAGTFAGGNFNAGAVFKGPEDLSLWERCITRGVPSAIFPTVYNANTQHRAGAGRGGHHLRDDPRHPHHSHRRPPARARRDSRLSRRLARPLGGRHARGGRHQLLAQVAITAAPARRCTSSSVSRVPPTACATKCRWTTRARGRSRGPPRSTCRRRARRCSSTPATRGTTRCATS